MAEFTIYKTSEKVVLWLHRENKTQQWLAEEIGVTRQAISQKITGNEFSDRDIQVLKRLGCTL